ncbi:MAG: class I SAM-dependent methyltransferase [Candidatus Dormibacteraceae bacterium]
MDHKYLSLIEQYWNDHALEYCQFHPEHHDLQMHPSWGLSHIPESELCLLPSKISDGELLVDLGCGQGHDSVGFADLGYRVLGVDLSRSQISRAIPHRQVSYLVGSAECLPLPSASVSVVVSDHGAFDHSPSGPLLRETHRILVAGGTLIVCGYSPLALACFNHKSDKITSRLINRYPCGATLSDNLIVATQHSHSSWMAQFKAAGFNIDRLEEPLLPPGKRTYFDELVDEEWARSWPVDLIWVVRKGLKYGDE